MSNTALSIELLKLMQATRRYLTEIKLNEHIYMFEATLSNYLRQVVYLYVYN